MKKLLTILLLALSFNAFSLEAGMREEVRCIEGYKFLYVWHTNRRVPAVIQIFEQNVSQSGRAQPMKCN